MIEYRNILFFNQAIEFGGHEIMSLKIIKNFSKRSLLNIIVCSHKNNVKFIEELNKIPNIKIIIHDINYSKVDFLKGIFHFLFNNYFKKLLNKENIHTVISIQGSVKMSAIIHFSCRRLKINSIAYIPSYAETKNIVNKLINKLILKLPINFIVISEYWKEVFMNITKKNKRNFHVINNLLTNNFSNHENNFSNDKKKIFLIGRLCSYKNQIFLCETLKIYPDLINAYDFFIVGDGQDYELLSNHISVKTGKIKILPWDSSNDLYLNADIILMTSVYEGLPLVAIEAMALKKPLILPGIKELKDLTISEFIYTPGDYFSLNKILKDNVSQFSEKAIQRNYEYYKNNFTNEIFEKNCEEFFQYVLK
ncbi:glycosyltransferase [Silvanigrella paludirubra]|nr:glycosyltransferase [Silvanigrella paludirubra]